MKLTLSVIFQLILIHFSTSQFTATVCGKISNPVDQEVYIHYYKDFISYEIVNAGSAQLNSDGEFSMTFSLNKPIYADFMHGDEWGKLFINVNDSLILEVDASKFDETLKFAGSSADINNYLAQKTLKFPKGTESKIHALPEKEFLLFIDSLQNAQLKNFNDYFSEVQNKSSSTKSFMELEEEDIIYHFFETKMVYPGSYSYFYKLKEPIILSNSYYNFLKQVSFDNQNALNSISYVQFIESYINYEVSKIYKKDTTLNIIELKDQFIDTHFTGEIKSFSYAKWAYRLLIQSSDYVNGKRIVEKYKNSSENKKYAQLLDQALEDAARLAIGNPAPNFTYPDTKGKLVSLTDFLGKVVYLDIWSSWCGPCIREIPFAKELEEQLKEEDIIFLYLSIDENEDAWKKMVTEKELKGVHLISKGTFNSNVSKLYNVFGIPKYLIIDKQGNISDNDAKRPSGNVYNDLKSILER